MISRSTIARIIETVRIEEVVGDFISLRRKGKDFAARCPFHEEKTPSFYVSPSKGIFKCFGCGKAGDAIRFVMEHEKYTYPEALKYLAKKYNIEIEETQQTEEDRQKENEMESVYLINAFAQKYFTNNLLNTDEGKSVGMSYLKERGFTEESINKFQLGYALLKQNAFAEWAAQSGYKTEHLKKAGLITERGDFFQERIIFPIHNLTGRVVAFGGRIIRSNTNEPKYKNSPETDIYTKSKTLYGLFFAKKSIVASGNCLLVEGYTDVISMHRSGIENVVASSGTSLTPDQLRFIKRYTENLTILYDGDPAGIKASLRGIDLALEEGLNVKVVLLPDGDDPDSFTAKHSSTEVREFILKNTADFIRFKARLLLQEIGNDLSGKARAIKSIVSSISLIPDSITRTVYIKECSEILKMPEEVLNHEVYKERENFVRRKLQENPVYNYRPETADTPPSYQPVENEGFEAQERDIIRLLLNYGNKKIETESETGEKHITTAGAWLVADLQADNIEFGNPVFAEIFRLYALKSSEGTAPEESFFTTHPDIDICTTTVELTTTRYHLSDWEKRYNVSVPNEEMALKETITRALFALKEKLIRKLLKEVQDEIKNSSDEEQRLVLLQREKELQEVKKQISVRLGKVISPS